MWAKGDAFNYYFDKSMRRNGTRHRKSIGIGLSVFHSLCWIVIMFFMQDYETAIMPCAGVLIGVSVALSINKDKQAWAIITNKQNESSRFDRSRFLFIGVR